jgi:hypothetical protein
MVKLSLFCEAEVIQMAENRKVTVSVYGGTEAEKILVEELGDVLLLTTEEEWMAALQANRAPVVVGFRREYLV